MKFAMLAALCAAAAAAADLRLGIVGTDTSHVITFIRLLNDPNNPDHVPGARVVAAYKGGSPDFPLSASRTDKFAEELRTQWKVEIVPDIATLCAKVDGVLLHSVDGRVHLRQVKEILTSRKPVFIDKPLATTLADAREIARVLREAGVPWFSASPHRFNGAASTMTFADAKDIVVWGPGPMVEHHALDLAWYGVHSIEMLYTMMGPGCERVARLHTADTDVVTGRWKDGRTGTVLVRRPSGPFGAVVFRAKGIARSPEKVESGYPGLMRALVRFFQTKQPPIANDETVEIISFMDAAQRSKEAGGAPMPLR